MTIVQSDIGCNLWCATCGAQYWCQVNMNSRPPVSTPGMATYYPAYHYSHPATANGCVGAAELSWFSDIDWLRIYAGGGVIPDQAGVLNMYAVNAPPPLPGPRQTPLIDPPMFDFSLDPAPAPKVRPLCECGAHAIGIGNGKAGHSGWCPAAPGVWR